MTNKRILLLVLTICLTFSFASSSMADVSNSAALFLRIAPGARAAGMGEAFVAVADDATTVHYNPAGLGAYPLSASWFTVSIPTDMRPLKGFAPLKARGGSNVNAYDLWTISPKGLLRFDGRKWSASQTITTRTEDTIERIVQRFFNENNPEKLSVLIDKVAFANNLFSLVSIQEFREKVIAATPNDYSGVNTMKDAFDSLIVAYPQCRINSEMVSEARKLYDEGMKDATLSTKEIDRISFAIERAKTRFIPEEVILPYSARIDGELVAIASTGNVIMIATNTGIYKYNGMIWQKFTTENGLPSNNVLCMSSFSEQIYIGTDSGICRFNGITIDQFPAQMNAPKGTVSAIGGDNSRNVFAFVENDLYHFDGVTWSNTMLYTVALDDTPDMIARKYSVYGTETDKATYISKFKKMFDPGPIGSSESTAVNIDSLETASMIASLKPGSQVLVPYLAEIKGKVTSITAGAGMIVWIGTNHGLFSLDKDGWKMPGFKQLTLESTQSVQDVIASRRDLNENFKEEYITSLKIINDLSGDTIPSGSVINVPTYPHSGVIQKLGFNEQKIYVVTSDGLLERSSNNKFFIRSEMQGLGHSNSADFALSGTGIWFGSNDKIAIWANGRSEINTMYVKWLPTLADDMYYTYFSGVHPTRSAGTFGGSLTFISYGNFTETNAAGDSIGQFQGYEGALTLSWGTSISSSLRGGISGKFIYSHLASQGQENEKGTGTGSDFAIDLGILYHMTPRINLGVAITNLGPKISYIDAAQADELPRNLAIGLSYKLLQNDYLKFTISNEINKSLTGLNHNIKVLMQQAVLNGGVEIAYLNLFSGRVGYIYDEEGDRKLITFGAGLRIMNTAIADFAFIPSQGSSPLNNILRVSFGVQF